jgi:hypothetical protein
MTRNDTEFGAFEAIMAIRTKLQVLMWYVVVENVYLIGLTTK